MVYQHENPDEPDIMSWFPRREDYDDKPAILPDESYEEKIQRLHDTIESAQASIKEVVDTDNLTLECKIYRTMDTAQDMEDILKLQKEIEAHPDASQQQDALKKARVGFINLKAYINQVDCVEFAAALRNEFLFKVGSSEGFGPWLDDAEDRIKIKNDARPKNYKEGLEFEQQACLLLKDIVKGNKLLKTVQDAAEAIRGNVQVQEEFSKMSERYYVLCKKADGRVKNLQVLLREWQALDEILAPTKPADMDDLQPKYFVSFLRTYASYFAWKSESWSLYRNCQFLKVSGIQNPADWKVNT